MVLWSCRLYWTRDQTHAVASSILPYLIAQLMHHLRNATAAPIKRTAVERQVNVQIVFLFFLLLALSLGSAIGSVIRVVSVKFAL